MASLKAVLTEKGDDAGAAVSAAAASASPASSAFAAEVAELRKTIADLRAELAAVLPAEAPAAEATAAPASENSEQLTAELESRYVHVFFASRAYLNVHVEIDLYCLPTTWCNSVLKR